MQDDEYQSSFHNWRAKIENQICKLESNTNKLCLWIILKFFIFYISYNTYFINHNI